MRLVFGIGSGLLVIFALLIAGARQIGHRQERDIFPLPSADGCWQGLCFLEMSEDEIVPALVFHPDVTHLRALQINSERRWDTYLLRIEHKSAPPITVIFS